MSAQAAPTELAPAPGASPQAPYVRGQRGVRRPPRSDRLGVRRALWWPTLLVGAIFCAITFYATGGLQVESMTTTEMALTILAGAIVAVGVIVVPAGARAYGLWPAALLLAFTALTAVSIVWSVQPDRSWLDADRMLAFSGVFAAAIMLVHIAPARWPAVLGGLTLAAVVVCGYALLTKVFPSLAPANVFARVNEPYGYWNAVGLTAAMGAICCMWLGARRTGHALLRALAYPAMGLLLLTLLLAYSRGALAALALGLLLWFSVVPLRLRGAALLIAGALGAGIITVWDFSRHALSAERVPLYERAAAGHQLGALVLAMLVLLTLAGIATGFLTGRQPPSPRLRRQAGRALIALIAVALIAFAAALAHSHRGLTGSVSHVFSALTDPNARTPPNTPGRLTAVASVRARYWKEALQVFRAHPALGAGAEGYATAHLRYETEALEVRHAHGFIVQTLADLGLVGLVLALALLLTWMAAAGRATHLFNRGWTSWHAWREIRAGARPGWKRLPEGGLSAYTPERIGLLSMLCVVVVFGAHSLIDWTWYVPGDACVALLCAGWLAGRGPLHASASGRSPSATAVHGAPARSGPPGSTRPRPSYLRRCLAGAAIVAALLAAWSQWQPQRSEEASQQALALLKSNPRAASAAAKSAVARDPLSAEAQFTLAEVQRYLQQPALARATLERAVRMQPSNPQTWLTLGRYELTSEPASAVRALQAAIYLDPELISPEAIASGRPNTIEVHNDYIQALRAQAVLKSASDARARVALGGRPARRRHPARARPRSRTRRSTG